MNILYIFYITFFQNLDSSEKLIRKCPPSVGYLKEISHKQYSPEVNIELNIIKNKFSSTASNKFRNDIFQIFSCY